MSQTNLNYPACVLYMYHYICLINALGCIGAIDGCHINIKAPSDCPASYVNRKGVHSILLQAVCDHELVFTDCYAGETHYSRLINVLL